MNWIITLLRNMPKALELIDGDGHTLYNPKYLIERGYPVDFVKKITYRHESDYDNLKATIFDPDGKPVDSMLAVAALDFHYAVAAEAGLVGGKDYELYNGRGFQARAIAEAVRKAVDNVL